MFHQHHTLHGVCLSETLEWEAHINKITSKANSTLGFLRRNLNACPTKLRNTAYFSLVRSSLEYSSAVWDSFRQKDIDKLEKIQAAARFVTQNYRQTSNVTSLIQNLGWTDSKTRRKNTRLLCMFKILNELVEIPIIDRLIPADKRTRGGHNQAYKHIRATTTLEQILFGIELSLIGILFRQMPYNQWRAAGVYTRSQSQKMIFLDNCDFMNYPLYFFFLTDS